MAIICPNLSDKQVKSEFEELVNTVGEVAAYDIWSQNNGNGIDKTPNGESSILFKSLLNQYNNDKIAAIKDKAIIYSKSFKVSDNQSFTDENGEPTITSIYKYKNIDNVPFANLIANTNKSIDSTIETIVSDLNNMNIISGNISGIIRPNLEAFSDTFALKLINNIIENRYGVREAAKYRIRGGKLIVDINWQSIVNRQPRTDNTSISNESVITLANAIAKKFGVNIKVISPEQALSLTGKNNINSFIIGDIAYLVDGRFTADVSLEEVMHPFVLAISKENNELFNSLFFEARRSFPELWKSVQERYNSKDGFNDTTRKLELVTQALANSTLVSNKSWLNKLSNFIRSIADKILIALGINPDTITADLLKPTMTLSDLADLINTKATKFGSIFISTPQYSLNESINKLDKVYNRIIEGIDLRLKALENYTVKDQVTISKTEKLREQLDRQQDKAKSIITFINDTYYEAQRNKDRVQKLVENPENVTASRLLQLGRDYINFYQPMFFGTKSNPDETIDYLLSSNAKQYFDFLDNATINDTMNKLRDLRTWFASMETNYNILREKVVSRILLEAGIDSPTINKTLSQLRETDEDIWNTTLWLGSMGTAGDEILRIMHVTVANAKNEVDRRVWSKGKQLLKLYSKVKRNLNLLREKFENGDLTGNLIRPLNYGRFRRDYEKFLTQLNAKYGVEELYELPKDRQAYYNFLRERDEWLSGHAERKYTKKYYDALLELTPEAREARNEYSILINEILQKVSKDGEKPKLHLLSDSDYRRLQILQKQRANLANDYYEDGTPKSGIDAEIAKSIQRYNEKINSGLTYKVDQESFNKENERMLETLSPEEYRKWYKRNTRIEYSQEFWDTLNNIERAEQTDEYNELMEYRRQLERLFRNADSFEIDQERMSADIKHTLELIDLKLDAIRVKTASTGGITFNDIAEIVVSDAYRAAKEKALAAGEVAYNDWRQRNHYLDKKGRLRPYSYWTYIKPKSKSMIKIVPNQLWREVSTESGFYNKNYKPELADQGLQPKKALYDNSKAYNKAMANKEVQELYKALINTMQEAYDMLTYKKFKNAYRLPQITGTTWTQIAAKDNLLNGIYSMLADKIIINGDDTKWVTEQAIRRPDGSVVNFVPTMYMTTLDDQNTITRDMVGSIVEFYRMAVNYQEMNKIAPELEAITEQLGVRNYKGRFRVKSGQQTNTYKKAVDFIEMQLYNIHSNPLSVTIGNKRISFNKILNSLAEYVRRINLFGNVWAMLANRLTASSYNRIESMLSRYYTKSDLFKANTEFIKEYPAIVKSIGDPFTSTKILSMMQLNQISRTNREIFDRLNESQVLRSINQNFWYGGYTMGDFAVKSKMLLAIYFNNKFVKEAGKFMSRQEFINTYYANDKETGEIMWNKNTETLYDAYEFKNGDLTVKGKYKQYVDSKLLNRIKNTSNALAAKLDGILTDLDRTKAHTNAIAQFFLLHRNWMLAGAQERFKVKQYNYMTETVEEGTFRTVGKYFFSTIKEMYSEHKLNVLKNLLHKYQGMENYEKYNVRKVTYELLYSVLILGVISTILRGIADEDEEDWYKNATAYMAARVRFEMQAFYNPSEILNILNSPTAATSTIENTYNTIRLLLPSSAWWDEDIDYGDRLLKYGTKLMPGKAIIGIQYPREKMIYMDNQLLWK